MRINRMVRLFYLIFPIILLFALLSDAKKITKNDSPSCLKCHEETLMTAITNPYQHIVVQDSCVLCHKIEERVDESKVVLWSSSFQSEGTVFIGSLDANKHHKISIEATNIYGKKSERKDISIKPMDKKALPVNTGPLKMISDVRIERITKGLFVEATINWNTNVPATSSIEYRLGNGKYRTMSSAGNLFTRNQSLIFNGLKHKSKYIFRVVSKDISGNVLKSTEYTLNTSDNIAYVNVPEEIKKLPTLITNLGVVKNENNNDYYIKVAANKPVQFKVWIKEVEEETERPCVDFVSTRFSTIAICIKCHQQNSSHPVGVRSKNPKIVVSDNLPTIENGLLTCVTCHYAHGGKTEYYLRVKFTEEICAKCHDSYYKY